MTNNYNEAIDELVYILKVKNYDSYNRYYILSSRHYYESNEIDLYNYSIYILYFHIFSYLDIVINDNCEICDFYEYYELDKRVVLSKYNNYSLLIKDIQYWKDKYSNVYFNDDQCSMIEYILDCIEKSVLLCLDEIQLKINMLDKTMYVYV